MIKGSFFILFFYFLGELISYLIQGLIPGSVIGMILLFLSLFFKLIKPEMVKNTATVITKNMAVFFVPAAVGLMVYYELISKSMVAILSSIVVSSVLVIVTVSLTQEYFEKKKNKLKKDE
jgi:holin-like protein